MIWKELIFNVYLSPEKNKKNMLYIYLYTTDLENKFLVSSEKYDSTLMGRKKSKISHRSVDF